MSARESMLLDAMGDRFEVLLRRYDILCQNTPVRFGKWLCDARAQERQVSSLESVCIDLFPDLLDSGDAPRRWMLAVSIVALKHHIAQLSGVELSACGRALRLLADGGERASKPSVSRAAPAASLLKALSYTSALEVRVAELECRLKNKNDPSPPPTKRSKPTPALPDTPEQAVAFLCERRAEALDALLALRRARSRKRTGDRLRGELARIKADSVKPRFAAEPILPKRALSLAGYWNIMPNDLLTITPALIAAIEERGGTVLRREGMHVCFSSSERPLVIDVVLEVMGRLMPHYKRREED